MTQVGREDELIACWRSQGAARVCDRRREPRAVAIRNPWPTQPGDETFVGKTDSQPSEADAQIVIDIRRMFRRLAA